MESYKGFYIYEKDGLYTVGGINNAGYEDCTLENLNVVVQETDMVAWCLENGIQLEFNDLRCQRDNPSYEDYLNHLERFDTNPDLGFVEFELIVSTAIFSSTEQAKGFIDWLADRETEFLHVIQNKPALDVQIESAAGRAGEKPTSVEKDVSIHR